MGVAGSLTLGLHRWAQTAPDLCYHVLSPGSLHLFAGSLSSVTAAMFFGMQVVKSWSEPSSPVSGITGTPMYMAIQVLQGKDHTPNTALESLLYSILSICSDGHLSDCGADFVDDPVSAAMQRLGFMIQPALGALQHVPHDKRDFVAALHDVFFPTVDEQPLRSHRTDVLPAHVKAACSKFLKQ